jgi:hypothetical protein
MTSPAAPSENAPRRIGTLEGDRLCARCGYNLTGQPIFREAHYELLIARCPECGAVASLQEYPLLGRWAGRWAAVAAALWFLFILAIAMATAGTYMGLAAATGEQASHGFGEYVQQRFLADMGKDMSQGYDYQEFMTWRDRQHFDLLLVDAGGFLRAMDRRALWLWIPLGLLALVGGVVWAVILVARRRRGMLICALAIMVLTGALCVFPVAEWLNDERYGYYPGWFGRSRIAPQVLGLSLVFTFAVFVAGMMIGRPIVRLMIRTLLPPRLRSALAILWICDDLPPPSARQRGRIF